MSMTDKTAYALNLVRQALSRYTDTPADDIQLDSTLPDLQIDSLTLAELLFELEDHLGVTITEATTPPKVISEIVDLILPYIGDQDVQNVA
jgi:acyl carrier protein